MRSCRRIVSSGLITSSFAVALGSVACLQDFDTFEGTAATQNTPDAAADAAQKPSDASSDVVGSDARPPLGDASTDGGGCTSAPQACLSQRGNCRDTCNATHDTCRNGCPNGNPGSGCRQQCKNDQMTCEATCNTTCTTCAGSCSIGCI